jgi:GNAT superfamily N-acetyltransferase
VVATLFTVLPLTFAFHRTTVTFLLIRDAPIIGITWWMTWHLPIPALDSAAMSSEPLRGTGIGRQLMDAFEHWANDRKSVLVSLATRGAAAFYEHRGYTSKAGYYKKYFAPGSPR